MPDLSQNRIFKDEVSYLLATLEYHRLEIVLTEPIDRTGRRLRVVINRNPDWYSSLFQIHSNGKKGRKARSRIRRQQVVSVLTNMSKGVIKDTFTYNELKDLVLDRLQNGYYSPEYFCSVPPQLDENYNTINIP